MFCVNTKYLPCLSMRHCFAQAPQRTARKGTGTPMQSAVSSRRFIRSQCLLRSHGSEWCWVNVRRVTSHNVAGIGWHRESRQSLMNFRFANDFLCQLPIKHRKKKDSRQGEKERERDTQKKQCKRRRPAAINELRETGQKTLNIAQISHTNSQKEWRAKGAERARQCLFGAVRA